MAVVSEALELLGLGTGPRSFPGEGDRVREQQRELAALIRDLPDWFGDRIPARTSALIRQAAASWRRQQAIEELVAALNARAAAITNAERGTAGHGAERLACPCPGRSALSCQRPAVSPSACTTRSRGRE